MPHKLMCETKNPGETSCKAGLRWECFPKFKRLTEEGQTGCVRPLVPRSRCLPADYPLTLIFENDNTARPGIGRPIDVAGRKVVKISMFLTCGNSSSESSPSERMR